MAAYLVFYPQNHSRVLLTLGYFFTIRMVPEIFMIGIWALLQFISGIGSLGPSAQTTGVAYWAPIGGFLAGLVIAFVPGAPLGGGSLPGRAGSSRGPGGGSTRS